VPPGYSGSRRLVKSVSVSADNRVSDVLPVASNFALQENPASIKKSSEYFKG
jgi:hypothetical protein